MGRLALERRLLADLGRLAWGRTDTLIGDKKISEIDSVVASGTKICAAVYPADRCP